MKFQQNLFVCLYVFFKKNKDQYLKMLLKYFTEDTTRLKVKLAMEVMKGKMLCFVWIIKTYIPKKKIKWWGGKIPNS